MTTKTHTYEYETVVVEQATEEVTYCNGCGWPVRPDVAIPLFHGPGTEDDGPVHFHPECYRTLIRPPGGGTFDIEDYDDFHALAAPVARPDATDARARYQVPGTQVLVLAAETFGDVLRATLAVFASLAAFVWATADLLGMAVGFGLVLLGAVGASGPLAAAGVVTILAGLVWYDHRDANY